LQELTSRRAQDYTETNRRGGAPAFILSNTCFSQEKTPLGTGRRMGMNTLLIVEDDEALCGGICLALQNEATRCEGCHTLAAARQRIRQGGVDLLILDINLPDGNGRDFLAVLRKEKTLPVILLTANDMETDIVAGLTAGADDYITKPFSLAVLRARVDACLRRAAMHAGAPEQYSENGFCFDFDHMTFTKNGAPVELSKTEQKLLRLLIENSGHTLPRALLLEHIWPEGTAYVDENALSVTVKRLRTKLEEDPAHPRYIQTVYGIGYGWGLKA
jgi:DNA-binding response OmpR family regulator